MDDKVEQQEEEEEMMEMEEAGSPVADEGEEVPGTKRRAEEDDEDIDEDDEEVTIRAPPSAISARTPSPQAPTDATPTTGMHGNSDGTTKRQRRPNVRLNEIGDSSLANVVEYFLKRKGGGNGNSTINNNNNSNSNKPATVLTSPAPPPGSGLASASATPTVGSGVGAGAPGKTPKRTKVTSKLNKDQNSNSRLNKPYDKPGTRKPSIKRGRYNMNKHPRNGRVMTVAGNTENGSPWMQKANNSIADGFHEAADGGVYGSSDTDKHQSPHHHDSIPVGSSFDSDTPKVFRKVQPSKQKKKRVSVQKAVQSIPYIAKDDAEDKDEPSSSDVQELRTQTPAWERGLTHLDDKVREWLKGFGLEKYAAIFQHHEVTNDVVPLLTMEDLKEMGITAVGARRKIFNEIMKLRQNLLIIDDHLSDEK